VLGVDRGTAEEFHGRLLATAHTLDRSARQHANRGDSVSAVAAAWGADVTSIQAVLWERILIASRAPQRQYFQAAASLSRALAALDESSASGATAEAVLKHARERLSAEFDDSLRREVDAQLPEITYLAMLAAPTTQDMQDAVDARIDDHTPAEFVAERRRAAIDAMLRAQSDRIKRDIPAAIRSAYDSDFSILEGYLVESALAVGDKYLLTVTIRADLVTGAITELTGLPEDFAKAVSTLRDAMTSALNEADGERLRSLLLPL
jgi:hypothetical protein